MKKIIILCLLVMLMAPLGFSQVFVGGSGVVSYNVYGIWEDRSTLVRVNPILGYRLGIFSAGVTFEYQYQFSQWETSPTGRAGVFGELRFFTIENFSLLGRADFIYSVTGPLFSRWDSFHRLEFLGQGILEYALTDRLSVFSSLGRILFVPPLLDRQSYSFQVVLLPSVSLGFKFFF